MHSSPRTRVELPRGGTVAERWLMALGWGLAQSDADVVVARRGGRYRAQGIFFAAMSLFFALLFVSALLINPALIRLEGRPLTSGDWPQLIIVAPLLAAGGWIGLWMGAPRELVLYLRERRWTLTGSTLRWQQRQEGTADDFRAVRLEPAGEGTVPAVRLLWKRRPGGLPLYTGGDIDALGRHIAAAFGLPLVDEHGNPVDGLPQG